MKLAKKTLFILVIIIGFLATMSIGFELYRIILPEEDGFLFYLQHIANLLILPLYILMSVYISVDIYNKERRIPSSLYLMMGIAYWIGAIIMFFSTTSGIFFMAFAVLCAALFGLPAGFMSISLYLKTRNKI